ncbi:TIGR03503 family protein [Paraglaciecola aestuariivivens]
MSKLSGSALAYAFAWLMLCCHLSVTAQTSSTSNLAIPDASQVDPDSPIRQLGSKYHNSIELLQNRFRIDYAVEEITMVFFREFGSAPIVLVRPDGSKIYQDSADGETVFWFDTSTYDMVSIKNPTPGPWQAVGQIIPNSRVMVISELALHADPLPSTIFSGEILKLTAYLTNAGKPINYREFRDVVEVNVTLSSTNNPNYNNFGANAQVVATFEDNGKGMDEVPLDGVFTGQFNLAIADGEWIPTFSVHTPMFSREQVDPTIMLLPNPILIDVELADDGDGYHKLKVDAERNHVDMSTLLIDGKVRFPNGDIQNFSITDMSTDVREYLIVNYDYGVYRVKLTAYGNTLDGREFILDVPEYSFLAEEPIAPIQNVNSTKEGSNTSTNDLTSGVDAVAQVEEEIMATSTLIGIIVSINLIILIVGGGLIWWMTKANKGSVAKPKPLTASNDSNNQSSATEKAPGFFAKMFKSKAKQVAEPKAPDNKPKPEAEFKELSVPKE